jgi:thioredoxin reductase
VHLGTEATLRHGEWKTDTVVLATGSGYDARHQGSTGPVVLAWDLLSGKADAGKEVVIIGGGAVDWTALLLAQGDDRRRHSLFLSFNQAGPVHQTLLYRG